LWIAWWWLLRNRLISGDNFLQVILFIRGFLSCNSPLVVDPLRVGIGREKVFNLSLARVKTAPADAAG